MATSINYSADPGTEICTQFEAGKSVRITFDKDGSYKTSDLAMINFLSQFSEDSDHPVKLAKGEES